MLAEPAVLALSLAYLGLLFAVAYFGDRHQRAWSASSTIAPTVYGLSLAIYCTSWTFYGAVGRASTAGFDFILIYTGPVLVITAGYPMVAKMVRLAKQHNVTSIADFLASRYGKSRAVGVTATLFATVGVLPYIALQLQAVSSTFRTVAEPAGWIDGRAGVIHTDTSLIVAALMAVFTILFGVRNVQASEQHRGMMLAIAFESVVKLIALLTVGPFVLFVLFDGPSDLWARLGEQPAIAEQLTREGSPLTWIVTSLLSGMAFLCLPRQFHVAVVEHGHPASLRTARWLFPLYLVLINLFVLPIAAAGLLLLGPQVNPDLYVLRLPLGHGASWLSTLVFIGGLSAATSMVIVACMALSAMIGNELLMPYVLRSRAGAQEAMGPMVVFVRRAAVVLILMAGYAYERIISGYLPLASIGLISFCAVSNFAPGLVLGLYWRRAHRYGVVAGLAGGFVVWLYALLLPSLQATAGGPAAPLRAWLPPPLADLDPVGQGFVVGILVNTLLLVGVSLLVRARGADAEQADAFVLGAEPEPPARPTPADAQRLSELRELLARFVGSERALRALGSGPLSLQAATAQAERMLSGTLGAASARVIVGAFGRRGRLLGRSARALIDEASEAIRYNYDILRNSLDHVGMGIAAFDKDGRLEISNDRFATLLPLDHALLRRPEAPLTHEVGTPGNGEEGGRVVELRLDPLPGGGFVATCNDVTARVRTAEALHDSDRQLRRAAETLEQRVAERTAELEASRAEAEAANLGKTRFIAAASHDLLQPLHAARLFTAAMIDRDPGNDLGGKIDASLGAVESLLDALLDISKLDAGAFKPEKRPFALQPMFESLGTAFAPVAARRDVDLVVVRTRAFVDTDPAFLRRILQNLLSNALRYGGAEGRPQRVLLGCRREGEFLRLEVKDNGPGIAADKQTDHLRRVRAPAAGGRPAARGARAGTWPRDRRPHRAHARAAGAHLLGAGRRLDLLGAGAARRGGRRPPGGRPGAAAPAAGRVRELRALHRQRGAGARGDGGAARWLGLPRRHGGDACRGARLRGRGRPPARSRAGRSPSRRGAGRARGRRPAAQDLEPRRAGRADHRRPRPHVARPCPCPSGRASVQAGQARRPARAAAHARTHARPDGIASVAVETHARSGHASVPRRSWIMSERDARASGRA